MGDENHGLALVGPLHERKELLLQDLARLGIERRERFVHQQDRGVHGKRAHQAHALLHPAGELVGIMALEAREPDQLKIVRDPFTDLRVRRARHRQAEGRVVVDGLPREQPEMLEHHGHPVGRPSAHRFAVDQKLATADIGQPRDRAQQRGLAAARGSHHAHDFVALDRERELMERDNGSIEKKFTRPLRNNGGLGGCIW